jgi:mRNA-degrading endonuclease YafQ of YafQ-DinJ toxin-antitoxin module
MKVKFTQGFQDQVSKLSKKDPDLADCLSKQFQFFANNPLHPSLKFHKLKGKRSEQYAIWIKADLRALAVKQQGAYIFFEIVTHDQY